MSHHILFCTATDPYKPPQKKTQKSLYLGFQNRHNDHQELKKEQANEIVCAYLFSIGAKEHKIRANSRTTTTITELTAAAGGGGLCRTTKLGSDQLTGDEIGGEKLHFEEVVGEEISDEELVA